MVNFPNLLLRRFLHIGRWVSRWATFLIFAALAVAQQTKTLKGTVNDSTGAPVRGARVEFRANGASLITSTDDAGRFSLTDESGGGTLKVSYPGFSNFSIEIKTRSAVENLQVVLSPAPSLQRLEVKSNANDKIPAVPMSEFSIPQQQIDASGSLVVDDG